MADLSHYTGTSQSGSAYQVMLENDSPAPGSVDRVLMARMVRLTSETSAHLDTGFTPSSVVYKSGSRPQMEHLCGGRHGALHFGQGADRWHRAFLRRP